MKRSFPQDKILKRVLKAWSHSDDEDWLLFDPIKDTKNFVRKPFGTSIRERMKDCLHDISGDMCEILELCLHYPWLLSEDDKAFLEDVWFRVDTIVVRKKG